MALLLCFSLAGSMFTQTVNADGESNDIHASVSVKSGESAVNIPQNSQEIVDDMGIGFNMGKVFSQSISSNLDTFQRTVDAAVAEGFETIRIPTNWAGHIDENGHLVDTEYAQKVKSFVKYAMDKGVYVILNSHEDLGFTENSYWDLSEVTTEKFKTQYTNLWTDIANLFPYEEFGYRLLFEVTNEPKNYKGPVYSGYKDYQNLSAAERNQKANDGWYFAGRCGNLKYMETLNEMFAGLMKDVAPDRYYLITSYNANIIAATEEYSNKNISYGTFVYEDINYHGWGNNYLHMPSVNKEKAILSIHIYDLSQWDDYLARIKQPISANHIDIPIYIGETGMYWNNKETSGPLLKMMLASARENNISAALWDDSQSMGYINRTTGEWYDKSFMDEVVEAGQSKKANQPTEPTTEATTEEKSTEVTTEEKVTEATTEEKPTEATTEEKSTEVTTEEKSTEEKVTETTTEEKPTKLTTEEKPTEVTTEEKGTEATTEEKSTGVTTEEKTTEVTAEEKTTKPTTEEKTTEEKPTEPTTEEKITEVTTEATTEEKSTEVTTEERPTMEEMPKRVTKLKLKALHLRKVKVTWKKENSSKGYQIVYATDKRFKNKKVKNCKVAEIVLKRLKINKTYYVKVRAYRKINGKNVYGPWSKVKKIKIKK